MSAKTVTVLILFSAIGYPSNIVDPYDNYLKLVLPIILITTLPTLVKVNGPYVANCSIGQTRHPAALLAILWYALLSLSSSTIEIYRIAWKALLLIGSSYYLLTIRKRDIEYFLIYVIPTSLIWAIPTYANQGLNAGTYQLGASAITAAMGGLLARTWNSNYATYLVNTIGFALFFSIILFDGFRLAGLWQFPTYFALHLCIALTIILFIPIVKHRILWAAAFLIGIFLTGTRTAEIFLLGLGGVGIMLRLRSTLDFRDVSRAYIGSTAAMFVVVLAAFYSVVADVFGLISILSRSFVESNEERLYIINIFINYISSDFNYFGHGSEGWFKVLKIYGDLDKQRPVYTHNDLIRVVVETGIIGTLYYFCLILLILKRSWDQRKRELANFVLLLLVALFSLTHNVIGMTIFSFVVAKIFYENTTKK